MVYPQHYADEISFDGSIKVIKFILKDRVQCIVTMFRYPLIVLEIFAFVIKHYIHLAVFILQNNTKMIKQVRRFLSKRIFP